MTSVRLVTQIRSFPHSLVEEDVLSYYGRTVDHNVRHYGTQRVAALEPVWYETIIKRARVIAASIQFSF